MKWIGQHIYDLISRFRNDVYLEDVSTGTIASGSNLGLDSNNKIVKATITSSSGDIEGVTAGTGLSGGGTTGTVTLNVSGLTVSEIAAGSILVAGETFADNDTSLMSAAAINDRIESFGYTTNTGDITGVSFTTDSGAGSRASDASGTADFSILGTSGVGVTNSTTTITVTSVPGEIDHDSLLNFAANEHYTQANITTVGTIGTGVWQGTAIAQAYIAGDAINGDKIADDAVDSEHYTDGSIDTAHIADDQVTFAKAVGITPNIYGSIIKVLPSDFMANEEPGVTKTLQFVDNDASGIKPGDNNTELLAFVSIPETMKATHVDVYADDTLAFSVYELNIHESVSDISAASKGTGNCNTTLDITDVNATATNYLLIQVITVSKADRVFGAKVTIATQ
jgi:hypothetical protein